MEKVMLSFDKVSAHYKGQAAVIRACPYFCPPHFRGAGLKCNLHPEGIVINLRTAVCED